LQQSFDEQLQSIVGERVVTPSWPKALAPERAWPKIAKDKLAARNAAIKEIRETVSDLVRVEQVAGKLERISTLIQERETAVDNQPLPSPPIFCPNVFEEFDLPNAEVENPKRKLSMSSCCSSVSAALSVFSGGIARSYSSVFHAVVGVNSAKFDKQHTCAEKFVKSGKLLGGELAKAMCSNQGHQRNALNFLRGLRDRMRWADANEAASAFAQWAKAATSGGGSAAHKFAKCRERGTTDPCNDEGMPLDEGQSLQRIFAPFSTLWSDEERLREEPWNWSVGADTLPPITEQQLDEAILSKNLGAALGWENLPPRLLLELPRSTKLALIDLMHFWEKRPELTRLLVSVVCFIPKPGGKGFRPIGLTSLFGGLWAKVRVPVAQLWEQSVASKVFAGTAAADCEMTGWAHNLVSAWALVKGFSSCTAVLDISKFYENVSHGILLREARETGFNLVLLRSACSLYAGYRSATWKGLAPPFEKVGGTIVAGCPLALAIAKLMVVRLVRDLASCYPLVRCRNMVDDITLQAVGGADLLRTKVPQATAQVLQRLRDLKLPVEMSKCGVVASCKKLARDVCDTAALAGFQPHTTLRNLGTNIVANRKRQDAIAIARQDLAVYRARSLRRLQAAGANVAFVHKAGPLASSLWGTSVSGLSLSRLHMLRVTSARSLMSLPAGAAVGLRLGWADPKGIFDPACVYLQRTVKRWGLAVWNGVLSKDLLQTTLLSAAEALELLSDDGEKASLQENNWTQVVNPAEAYVASLARVGWRALSESKVLDHQGCVWDFRSMAPAAIASLAAVATRRWSDIIALRSQFDPSKGGWAASIFWFPLHRLKLQRREEMALRALVSGPVWTQAKLFDRQLSANAACRLCGEPRGTVWHRHFDCPANATFRRENLEPWLLAAARLARGLSEQAGEQFARCLLPDPAGLLPKALWHAETSWWQQPASSVISGLIFTDGSCLYPGFPALRRCGWALAQMNEQGEIDSVCYGPCPREVCPRQTIPEAEDYAIAQLRETAMPPMTLYPDCLATVRAVNAEGGKYKQATAERAHIWARYAATFEGAGITAEHVKAHASKAHVEEGLTTWWKKAGNDEVDGWAKKGAAMHPLTKEQVLEHKALHTFCKLLGLYLAKSAAAVADKELQDTESLEDLGPASRDTKQASELQVSEEAARSCISPFPLEAETGIYILDGHHLVFSPASAETAEELDPAECEPSLNRRGGEHLPPPEFEETTLRGSSQGRVSGEQTATRKGKEGSRRCRGASLSGCGVIWCRRCGAYCTSSLETRARPTAMLLPCNGRPIGEGRACQKRRALAGFHPTHGNETEADRMLAPAVRLSPWQVLKLETWKEQAAPVPAGGCKQLWAQELCRDDVLRGFGLTESTLAALGKSLAENERLADEETAFE